MATKRPARSPAPSQPPKAVSIAASNAKPVALTVKVDAKTYGRLCTPDATQRPTNQDILQRLFGNTSIEWERNNQT